MRILIPVVGFGRAGGYRVLSKLADHWIEQGCRVSFLVPLSSDAPYFPTVAEILWVDAQGRVVPTRNSSDNWSGKGWLNLLVLYRALRAVARHYDVVLANQSLTAWPVAAASRKSGFYYIQAYEPEYYSLKSILAWTLSRLSYFLPLKRIVNAPLYLDYKGIKARDWVPPGIDLSLFSPKAPVLTLRDRPRVVLGCIGRHEPAKGTRYVLEAFSKLHAQDSRYELKVAFGNLPRDWHHPATEVVTLESDAELSEFYRSIDVLIAPGTVQHGAAHYPVMEAMACGTAVVTTGYLPADDSNSWIVPNRDSSAIFEAVQKIRGDPSFSRRTAKALEDIAAFSWEEVSRKMLGIFKQKLSRQFSK